VLIYKCVEKKVEVEVKKEKEKVRKKGRV